MVVRAQGDFTSIEYHSTKSMIDESILLTPTSEFHSPKYMHKI